MGQRRTLKTDAILDRLAEKADLEAGMPAGGLTNQVIRKLSNTDYEAEWDYETVGGGGGGGGSGVNAFTFTNGSFTQPASGGNVTITVLESSWAGIGQEIYIQGGGHYAVASIPDTTHLIITNSGYPGNAVAATSVPGSSKVSPSGLQGPTGNAGAQGIQGITGPQGAQGAQGAQGVSGVQGVDAYTSSTAPFSQPAVAGTGTLTVGNTSWISVGQHVYLTSGGYYTVSSITDATHVVLANPGYPGNAAPGVTIAASSKLSAAGDRGAQGSTGATGSQGIQGITGPQGSSAYTATTSPYTQPASGLNITIAVGDTSWMVPGEPVYVQTGGYYTVSTVTDATHVILTNLGYTGNALADATIGTGSKVSPSGIQGAQGPIGLDGPTGQTGLTGNTGPQGANAYTTVQTTFTQPASAATVSVSVGSTSWMVLGQELFVQIGGHYTVDSITNATTVVLTNLGYSGNAVPTTSITSGSKVSPAGIQGPAGSAGTHDHSHSALTGIDTDTATSAIHHTLGTGANQAAAGDHTHADASETVKGLAEIATQTETNTGTDDVRYVTPLKLAGRTATETRTGVIELANTTEALLGTDIERAVTPAGLKSVADLKANATDLTNHLSDALDAHDASAISYAGGTGISSTDVEAALDELATEKVNVAGDTLTGALVLASDPSSAMHAATKQYVDAVRNGLDPKDSVRAATTANITLSGTQTIDGVTVIVGERVLVKNQTTPSENGIYVVAASTWSRAPDADSSAEVNAGLFTFVEEGTVNADTGWWITTNNPITLGSTSLTFAQFAGPGAVIAGAGVLRNGNTFSADFGSGAGKVAEGNDARLSDTRTPTDSSVTNAKVSASAAIAESKLNLASDAAAGTASRRTLGTSTTSAAAGNDSRFSDSDTWTFAGTLTATVTGAFKVPIDAPAIILSIRITLGTASSSGSVTVDCNKNGTTLYTTQGNRPTLASGATSANATLPDVTSLAAGDNLSVDIDSFGSGAASLLVKVRYRYT